MKNIITRIHFRIESLNKDLIIRTKMPFVPKEGQTISIMYKGRKDDKEYEPALGVIESINYSFNTDGILDCINLFVQCDMI